MKTLSLTALIAVAAAVPAAAQTVVSVPAFDSIQLRGGGAVTVRHGPAQRVTLVSGDTAVTGFSVDRDGQLTIDACRRTCRDYDLRIEIVTPQLEGAAVAGGGSIRAAGAFPARGTLAVAVTGGGAVDVGGIESGSVAAAVRGGGAIRAHARNSLIAAVSGGGSITYLGDPSVTSSVRGGGSVAPARRR